MLHTHIYSLGAYLTNAYTTTKIIAYTDISRKKAKYYLFITSPKEFVRYMYHFDIYKYI